MKRFLSIVLLYTVLALAATHPLWQHLGDRLPGDVGDPVLNTYILAWDMHALVVDPANLFNANFFFPLPGTLAFSENLAGSALLALPLMLLSGEPVLAYNLMFLANFVLAGVGMYLLVLHITRRRVAAFVAGVAFAFAPYHMASLAHLQLLSIGWLPLLALVLSRILGAAPTAPRRTPYVLFCMFLWLQIASTLHGALFAALIVLVFAVVHARRLGALMRRAFLLPLAAFACLLLPLVLPYLAVLDELRASRPPGVAQSFSAQPSDFLAAYPGNRLFGALTAPFRARTGFSDEQTLFMGIAAPLLTLAALAGGTLLRAPPAPVTRSGGPVGDGSMPSTGFAKREGPLPGGRQPPAAPALVEQTQSPTPGGRRPPVAHAPVEQAQSPLPGAWNQPATRQSWMVFFAGLALTSLLLASSGALAQALPLAGVMRVPARWSAVLTFALAGLIGIGVSQLVGRFAPVSTRRVPMPLTTASDSSMQSVPAEARHAGILRRRGALLAGTCLAALLYTEGFAAPIGLADVGTLRGQHAIYYYLAQLPGREAVLELPLYTGTKRESVESKRMYASAIHWRPLVNGYSGITPERQLALADQLMDFPDDKSTAALRALGQQGVRYVIVHAGERGIPRREWNQTNRARALVSGVLKLVRTFDDNDLLEIVGP